MPYPSLTAMLFQAGEGRFFGRCRRLRFGSLVSLEAAVGIYLTYPSLPSLPCCSRPAKATCLEGLKVQKLLFGASFLSVQKVALGILG